MLKEQNCDYASIPFAQFLPLSKVCRTMKQFFEAQGEHHSPRGTATPAFR